jgi:hypothetical protein
MIHNLSGYAGWIAKIVNEILAKESPCAVPRFGDIVFGAGRLACQMIPAFRFAQPEK